MKLKYFLVFLLLAITSNFCFGQKGSLNFKISNNLLSNTEFKSFIIHTNDGRLINDFSVDELNNGDKEVSVNIENEKFHLTLINKNKAFDIVTYTNLENGTILSNHDKIKFDYEENESGEIRITNVTSIKSLEIFYNNIWKKVNSFEVKNNVLYFKYKKNKNRSLFYKITMPNKKKSRYLIVTGNEKSLFHNFLELPVVQSKYTKIITPKKGFWNVKGEILNSKKDKSTNFVSRLFRDTETIGLSIPMIYGYDTYKLLFRERYYSYYFKSKSIPYNLNKTIFDIELNYVDEIGFELDLKKKLPQFFTALYEFRRVDEDEFGNNEVIISNWRIVGQLNSPDTYTFTIPNISNEINLDDLGLPRGFVVKIGKIKSGEINWKEPHNLLIEEWRYENEVSFIHKVSRIE